MANELNDETLHRFPHEAMATTFEIIVAGHEREYARQAAAAAFLEVDRVEAALSQYVESSDIAQLNHAGAGKLVRVGERAFECLQIAARAYVDTGGAFDVTIGPLMACWRTADKSPRTPTAQELTAARARVGMNLIELVPESYSVRLNADGMLIDLGGIGKGFGLDQAAAILADWGIKSALVSGGESTVLAVGAPEGETGWPVGVGGAEKGAPSPGKVLLRDRALSGSGVAVKGRHIFDPRKGQPALGKVGAWSVCPSAAMADALSTAFMVMSPKEVEQYCRDHPETFAMLLVEDGASRQYLRFGDWKQTLGFEKA